MTWFKSAVAAAMLLAAPEMAAAQTYPSGPIKMLVGFPPGGTADIIARDLGSELEKVWRHPVVVENRAGANGALASQQLARMPADGHSLLTIVSGHVTNPLVSPSAGYDAIKDFTPISLVASSPLLIFAHPSFAPNNMTEAIKLAKAKPGTISYSTPGVGSIQQLSLELVGVQSGAKFQHVPYRGGAPALNDVIAGHVQMSVLSVFQALPLVRDKRLKPLAVTALKRNELLPEVQTVAEAGVPDYEASLLFGVIGPANMPRPVVDRLNQAINRVVQAPETKERFSNLGFEPRGGTPEDLDRHIKAEIARWASVINSQAIKPE